MFGERSFCLGNEAEDYKMLVALFLVMGDVNLQREKRPYNSARAPSLYPSFRHLRDTLLEPYGKNINSSFAFTSTESHSLSSFPNLEGERTANFVLYAFRNLPIRVGIKRLGFSNVVVYLVAGESMNLHIMLRSKQSDYLLWLCSSRIEPA